ncbi:hypothetical protein ACP26L_27940 [Paenibacillus sp. S-38]|uniref:hypothetical protein n=1 Tax=Paenibacillus sp. S-38 TaxID=3416710 RepID=UPI003CF8662F
MKKFVMGFLLGISISLSAVSYASDIQEVMRTNVKLLYKNAEIDLEKGPYEVFNYHGNNYVSVRLIAETLKLPIEFDELSNKILLGSYRLDESVELRELLNNDFKSVMSISIQYGDGTKTEVNDLKNVNEITQRLSELKLYISEKQENGYGYLYNLLIKTQNGDIMYPSNLNIQGDIFKSNAKTDELDSFIMSLRSQ